MNKILVNPSGYFVKNDIYNFYKTFKYPYLLIFNYWNFNYKFQKIVLTYLAEDYINKIKETNKIKNMNTKLPNTFYELKLYLLEGYRIDYGFDINNDLPYILMKSYIFNKKIKINNFSQYRLADKKYNKNEELENFTGYVNEFDDITYYLHNKISNYEFKFTELKQKIFDELFKQKMIIILAQYKFRKKSYFNLLPYEIIDYIFKYYLNDYFVLYTEFDLVHYLLIYENTCKGLYIDLFKN